MINVSWYLPLGRAGESWGCGRWVSPTHLKGQWLLSFSWSLPHGNVAQFGRIRWFFKRSQKFRFFEHWLSFFKKALHGANKMYFKVEYSPRTTSLQPLIQNQRCVCACPYSLPTYLLTDFPAIDWSCLHLPIFHVSKIIFQCSALLPGQLHSWICLGICLSSDRFS